MSLRSLLRNTAGNMSISFGIIAVPLILATGIALDTANLVFAKTDLQSAVDSAALAGGKAMLKSSPDGILAAQRFLEGNQAYRTLMSVEKASLIPNEDEGTFGIEIDGKVRMSLMRLVGIESMDISVSSTVSVGTGELELALVLDNTASMASEGRIEALKDATKQMLTKLENAKESGAKIKISIVPFADYVNVGLHNRNQPWLDVPPDTVSSQKVPVDDYSNATKSNCRIESGTWSNDGVPTPWQGEVCDWTNVTRSYKMEDVKSEWHGCVGSRGKLLQATIDAPSNSYPGLLDRWCPSPVLPLTNSFSALQNSADTMITQGQTYIPSGLVWGWNTLSSTEPFEEAVADDVMKKKGGRKVMMLMTDGNNTVSSDGKYHELSNAKEANNLTTELCNNIKATDIEIYTVGFKVTDPDTVDLLANCATSKSHAYSAANNSELVALFEALGESFSQVRLSQ